MKPGRSLVQHGKTTRFTSYLPQLHRRRAQQLRKNRNDAINNTLLLSSTSSSSMSQTTSTDNATLADMLTNKNNHYTARIEAQRSAEIRDVRLAQVADAIFSQGVRHEATFTNIGFIPKGNPAIPEVAFAGRSRCGITSLLRALFKTRSAVGVGNSIARRDGINAYAVGRDGAFHILETPGFGAKTVPWAVVLQHCSLLRAFCASRPNLKMLYWVMDVSESAGLSYRDMDTLKFLQEEVKNFTIVLSKVDKNRDMTSIFDELRYHGIEHPVIATSAWTLGGVDALRFDMVSQALHSLPTARLTMREVKQLGERMYSAAQLAATAVDAASGRVGENKTVPRLIHRPMSRIDEEHLRWSHHANSSSSGDNTPPGNHNHGDANNNNNMASTPITTTTTTTSSTRRCDEEDTSRYTNSSEGNVVDAVEQQGGDDATATASSRNNRTNGTTTTTTTTTIGTALTLQSPSQLYVTHYSHNFGIISDARRKGNPRLLRRSEKFLQPRSETSVRYIAQTSPWRNPYLWPEHVAATFNKRVNVIKCPEDPENPYLTQARFVVPRADWNFRRPNVIQKRVGPYVVGRGTYKVAAPKYFSRQFTIPFFPEIVDVRMHPQPVAFVGTETYYSPSITRRRRQLMAAKDVDGDDNSGKDAFGIAAGGDGGGDGGAIGGGGGGSGGVVSGKQLALMKHVVATAPVVDVAKPFSDVVNQSGVKRLPGLAQMLIEMDKKKQHQEQQSTTMMAVGDGDGETVARAAISSNAGSGEEGEDDDGGQEGRIIVQSFTHPALF